MGSCPSSDFKFCGIRNVEMKKKNKYKGSVLYLSEDGITCGSKTFPNTAALKCVTAESVLMSHSVELREKNAVSHDIFQFSGTRTPQQATVKEQGMCPNRSGIR